MGLDIMYGNNSFRAGSYSGFHNWRVKLAMIVGLDEAHMFMGKIVKKPGFEPLLNHSDCDGKLTYRQCVSLQKDFNKYILAAMENMNMGDSEEGEWWWDRYVHWKQAVDAVVKGEAKQIEFC
jgi:hypothetical protein